MPKKDDVPELAVCDGCGMERGDTEALGDLMLCEACENHRADDPVVTIHGRTLHYSELRAQAEAGDVDLKAALEGDSVQDQVRAAKKR
jgi:hypothetical protein